MGDGSGEKVSMYNRLCTIGMANKDAPDFGEIASGPGRKTVTYCNGRCASTSPYSNRHGLLVAMKLVDECPRCGTRYNLIQRPVSPQLFETLSKTKLAQRALKLEEQSA